MSGKEELESLQARNVELYERIARAEEKMEVLRKERDAFVESLEAPCKFCPYDGER